MLSEPTIRFLTSFFENGYLELTLGEGVNLRNINVKLQPLTIIGTTAKIAQVNRDLASWFITYGFASYSDEEFSRIVRIMARHYDLVAPIESIPLVVARCGNSLASVAVLFKRMRSYFRKPVHLTPNVLTAALDLLG